VPDGVKIEPELVSETSPCAERFEGTIALVDSRASVLCQGQDATVRFALARIGGGSVPAAIQKIRIADFDGIRVGMEGSFATNVTLGDLGALGFELVYVLFTLDWKSIFDESKLKQSLEIAPDRVGLGALVVSAPADAKPGRHEGKLVLEGNFETISLPLAFEVVPYSTVVEGALASLAAPVSSSTPVERLLASIPPGEEAKFPFDPDAPWVRPVWHRWVLAGREIWDLVNLRCLGPVIADGIKPARLGGSIDRPRVYVLNEESVDLVDVIDRRTVERLVLPRVEHMVFSRFLEVSPDGERVLAGNDQVLSLFVREAGAWKRTDLYQAKSAGEEDWIVWVECDTELRAEVLFGIKLDAMNHWRTVLRHDLATGARTKAELDVSCSAHAYGERQRLLVGVSERDSETLDMRFVKTPELSVTKLDAPGRVREVQVDPETGEVLVDDFMSRLLVAPDLKRATRLADEGPPAPRPRLLEGTTVRWCERNGSVTFSR
jgi:hypothetical protein